MSSGRAPVRMKSFGESLMSSHEKEGPEVSFLPSNDFEFKKEELR